MKELHAFKFFFLNRLKVRRYELSSEVIDEISTSFDLQFLKEKDQYLMKWIECGSDCEFLLDLEDFPFYRRGDLKHSLPLGNNDLVLEQMKKRLDSILDGVAARNPNKDNSCPAHENALLKPDNYYKAMVLILIMWLFILQSFKGNLWSLLESIVIFGIPILYLIELVESRSFYFAWMFFIFAAYTGFAWSSITGLSVSILLLFLYPNPKLRLLSTTLFSTALGFVCLKYIVGASVDVSPLSIFISFLGICAFAYNSFFGDTQKKFRLLVPLLGSAITLDGNSYVGLSFVCFSFLSTYITSDLINQNLDIKRNTI